jgi:hypothetical protein
MFFWQWNIAFRCKLLVTGGKLLLLLVSFIAVILAAAMLARKSRLLSLDAKRKLRVLCLLIRSVPLF